MGRRRSLADLSYSLVIGSLATLALLIIVAPVVIVLRTIVFTRCPFLK